LACVLGAEATAVAQDSPFGGDAQVAQQQLTPTDRELLVDHHRLSRGEPAGLAATRGWAEMKKARLAGSDVGRGAVVIDHPLRLIGVNCAFGDERTGRPGKR
jgi:hypothetical protein